MGAIDAVLHGVAGRRRRRPSSSTSTERLLRRTSRIDTLSMRHSPPPGSVGIGLRYSTANFSRSPAEKSGFGPSLTARISGRRRPKRASRFSTAKRRSSRRYYRTWRRWLEARRPRSHRLGQSMQIKLAVATPIPSERRCALRRVLGRTCSGRIPCRRRWRCRRRQKTAPEIYNIALDRLVLQPKDSIAFEDLRNGMLAAKLAGLQVVITPSHIRRERTSRGQIPLPRSPRFQGRAFRGKQARRLTGLDPLDAASRSSCENLANHPPRAQASRRFATGSILAARGPPWARRAR